MKMTIIMTAMNTGKNNNNYYDSVLMALIKINISRIREKIMRDKI